MRKLSEIQMKSILEANKPGNSLRKISEITGVSKSSVKRALEGKREVCQAGRKTILSGRKKSLIVRKFDSGEFSLASDASKWLLSEYDADVSFETVRSVIKEACINSEKRLKKPELTKKQMAAALNSPKSTKSGTCSIGIELFFRTNQSLICTVQIVHQKCGADVTNASNRRT